MRGVIDKKIEFVILSIRGMLEKAPSCEILVKSKIKNIKAGIKIKKIIEVKTTFECICNFLALKRESIISDQTKKPIPPITIKNAIVANIPGLEFKSTKELENKSNPALQKALMDVNKP